MPGILEGESNPPIPRLLDAPMARLDALVPRGDLWLDLTGAVDGAGNAAARAELGGQHTFENGLRLGGFLAGEVTNHDARAEAGIRLTF